MHNKEWFTVDSRGAMAEEKNMYFLANDKEISLRYDVLEMNFQISCNFYWFRQNRRRKEEIQMDLFRNEVSYNVSLEEIFSIPLFKKETQNETNEILKAKKIQQLVVDNSEIKKALVFKYIKFLTNDFSQQVIYFVLKERFASYDEVLNFRENSILGENDDFSQITNIEKCIVSSY